MSRPRPPSRSAASICISSPRLNISVGSTPSAPRAAGAAAAAAAALFAGTATEAAARRLVRLAEDFDFEDALAVLDEVAPRAAE
ncbi:hypothetical protein GCM10009099_38480 [Caenispirillum bisanense]